MEQSSPELDVVGKDGGASYFLTRVDAHLILANRAWSYLDFRLDHKLSPYGCYKNRKFETQLKGQI
jgi:protein associated with RNAse G/E